jgi:hypothetical protein
MIYTIVELSQCTVEVRNDEADLIFSRSDEELLRLSFTEFDQLLEAVARTESFTSARW